MGWVVFLILATVSAPGQSAAQEAMAIPSITNMKEIAANLKLARFKDKKFSRKIKIAVLDNGFNGYDKPGASLPADTHYDNGPASDADKIPSSSYHGLFMAQIVSQAIKQSGAQADFELHLINSFGYTKFAGAVDYVIKNKIDLVLYSQVWEFGGSGDGRGFINALVTKAVNAGIIWINAAGNFGRLTRLARVDGKMEGADEFIVFRDSKDKPQNSAPISCRPPPREMACPLKLVLAWNDFKEEPNVGTDKDLDLYLYDAKKQEVAKSARIQMLKEDFSRKENSIIPREMIETKIRPGKYGVRVKIKSKNFSASQDMVRITVSGMGVGLADPEKNETILPPADHPSVIAVGASDDPNTSKSKLSGRPHVYLKSRVTLKDGSKPFSTSTAAAMAAALGVLHLGTDSEANTVDALVAKLREVDLGPKNREPAKPFAKPGEVPAAKTPDEKPTDPGAPAKPAEPAAPKPDATAPSGETATTQPPATTPTKPAEPAPAPTKPADPGNTAKPAPEKPAAKTPPADTAATKPPRSASPRPAARPAPRPGRPPQRYVQHPPRETFPVRRANVAGCLPPTTLPALYPNARRLLMGGGAAVLYRGRPAIVVTYNVALANTISVPQGFTLFVYPGGLEVADPSAAAALPINSYELLASYNTPPVCGHPQY